MPLQYFFYLRLVSFLATGLRRRKLKKNKYFLNDYLGSVRQEIMKTLPFIGRKIEAF